tara:strand:- start:39475 stop:39813 length:339 start_codon:yes stop_codon:yes gene_type:complete
MSVEIAQDRRKHHLAFFRWAILQSCSANEFCPLKVSVRWFQQSDDPAEFREGIGSYLMDHPERKRIADDREFSGMIRFTETLSFRVRPIRLSKAGHGADSLHGKEQTQCSGE